jgi:hypothetical protein
MEPFIPEKQRETIIKFNPTGDINGMRQFPIYLWYCRALSMVRDIYAGNPRALAS